MGFEQRQIPIIEMLDSTNRDIGLKRKVAILEEIKIYAREPKIKKYGTRGHSPLLSAPAYIDKDIYEIAFFVKPSKTPVQIKNLNMYILYSSVDSCIFRINIYDNSEGYPNEKINTKDVIIKTSIIQGKWNVVDLARHNLVFNSDFYVSVEFIPDFKTEEAFQITYGAKLIKGGKTYFRESSIGGWTSFFANVSFNIEVIY